MVKKYKVLSYVLANEDNPIIYDTLEEAEAEKEQIEVGDCIAVIVEVKE